MTSPANSQMSEESEKVWTQLTTPSGQPVLESGDNHYNECTAREEQPVVTEPEGCLPPTATCEGTSYAIVPYTQPTPHLHCLQSGDGDYEQIMALVQADRTQRPYQPSTESRNLHNHKERLRRSRMKCSCDALRALVPGISDKTDKATVLEHTVAFLFHLSKCEGVKCDDYVPTYPPPMSAKLLDLYPTLMSGEYQYYEAIPSADPDYTPREMSISQNQVIEVHESDGKRYVTTTDGQQFMIVDTDDTLLNALDSAPQQMDVSSTPVTARQHSLSTEQQMSVESAVTPKEEPMEQSGQCGDKAVDMQTDDNKENIDPNGGSNNASATPVVRKKRQYRRKQKTHTKNELKTGLSERTDTEATAQVKTRRQRRLKHKDE